MTKTPPGIAEFFAVDDPETGGSQTGVMTSPTVGASAAFFGTIMIGVM
jgi:hypothetical protein